VRLRNSADVLGDISCQQPLTTPSQDGRISMREDFASNVEASVPIGRGGRPDDVAALTSSLASSGADSITGQVIEIHGGLEILRV
jgi:NAD(P)-dependent dehydrogenase (short-subunit alcohol dehydrogenase family)